MSKRDHKIVITLSLFGVINIRENVYTQICRCQLTIRVIFMTIQKKLHIYKLLQNLSKIFYDLLVSYCFVHSEYLLSIVSR